MASTNFQTNVGTNFQNNNAPSVRHSDTVQTPTIRSVTQKTDAQAKVDEAAPVLADTMATLFPNNKNRGWTDEQLKNLVSDRYTFMYDENNNRGGDITPEIRAAAQKLLDAGGAAILDPNGNPPKVTESNLRHALAWGLPDPSNPNPKVANPTDMGGRI